MKDKRKKYWNLGIAILLILVMVLPVAAMAQDPEPTTISVVSTNDFHGALVGRAHSWSGGDVVGGVSDREPCSQFRRGARSEHPAVCCLLPAKHTGKRQLGAIVRTHNVHLLLVEGLEERQRVVRPLEWQIPSLKEP